MPLPPGTYPIGGPIVPTAGGRLAPTQEMLDAGVIMPEEGRWYRVIATDAGLAWAPTDIPAGSAVLTRLAWSEDMSAWQAVSDVTTIYYALTRPDAEGNPDGAALVTALTYALSTGGNQFPSGLAEWDREFAISVGYAFNVMSWIALRSVWELDGNAPIAWALAPSRTGWAQNFHVSRGGEDVSLVSISNHIEIDGVPYDSAWGRVPGVRPEEDGGAGLSIVYTSPPDPDPVVRLQAQG